jgi:hypothetical protein
LEIETMNLDQFLQSYMVCALWSSTGDDGEPLDDAYGPDDIAPACRASMRETCADFIAANAADLAEYCERMRSEQWSGAERAGHDFWLTRNGHGAGFWDRGLGKLGDRLSAAAKVYGSVDLYAGDDGFIYGE